MDKFSIFPNDAFLLTSRTLVICPSVPAVEKAGPGPVP